MKYEIDDDIHVSSYYATRLAMETCLSCGEMITTN